MAQSGKLLVPSTMWKPMQPAYLLHVISACEVPKAHHNDSCQFGQSLLSRSTGKWAMCCGFALQVITAPLVIMSFNHRCCDCKCCQACACWAHSTMDTKWGPMSILLATAPCSCPQQTGRTSVCLACIGTVFNEISRSLLTADCCCSIPCADRSWRQDHVQCPQWRGHSYIPCGFFQGGH